MQPNHNPKVLVVGTTADYIEWIRRACPGRALFLTEPGVRRTALEPAPAPVEELLSDLADYDAARDALRAHLLAWELKLDGIACFDCESMELTAVLAEEFHLSYPSAETIGRCRDKYASKRLWQESGVPCPRTRLVRSSAELGAFFEDIGGPCVLKPLTGSGSELVFCCSDPEECERALLEIRRGLEARETHRMYGNSVSKGPCVVAEEFVAGTEFSCDFLVRDDRVDVLRLTRKIHSTEGPFGTIRGYALVTRPPGDMDQRRFERVLGDGAKALGITDAICMVDFLVRDEGIVLLEMTPRPGGDCLPFLLREAGHLDPLILTLDIAQRRPVRPVLYTGAKNWVGLRLHAGRNGVLRAMDVRPLRRDPRVREVHLIRTPGHIVRMPPEDYDSWLLGHVLMEPFAEPDVETQCHELFGRFVVEIES
ncbi:MAG: ATP-grasp domain-containing protein [Deltaproteobacteria bacterium]|nr:ATP-grasp domain-containing protein [Deltaproteobacteria bacterium]